MPSTMPDPRGLGPRVVARTPRMSVHAAFVLTENARAKLILSFPSSLLVPTPRSKFDPCAPLFGSRTSGRRYEWIVYRGGAGHVDRIEHGGGAGHGREPDENSGACSGPSHIATRRCF